VHSIPSSSLSATDRQRERREGDGESSKEMGRSRGRGVQNKYLKWYDKEGRLGRGWREFRWDTEIEEPRKREAGIHIHTEYTQH
jgi:hypothetical protein